MKVMNDCAATDQNDFHLESDSVETESSLVCSGEQFVHAILPDSKQCRARRQGARLPQARRANPDRTLR
jgi:hypothetical protein